MGLIILDLDGTLVADALIEVDTPTGTKLQRRQHECYHEPVLLEGRYDRLKQAAEEGDCFAIATNQGGVAWGYHTQAECYQRIFATVALLSGFWGQPFSVHVAFMHPKATIPEFKGDDGRKPSPTMLIDAMKRHNLNPAQTATEAAIMVGDRQEDYLAAGAIGLDYSEAGDFFGC